MRNPECSACGLTAADLPDEVLDDDEMVVETVLFETVDGVTYCQGCAP